MGKGRKSRALERGRWKRLRRQEIEREKEREKEEERERESGREDERNGDRQRV